MIVTVCRGRCPSVRADVHKGRRKDTRGETLPGRFEGVPWECSRRGLLDGRVGLKRYGWRIPAIRRRRDQLSSSGLSHQRELQRRQT